MERNAWSFVGRTGTEQFLYVIEAQRVQRTHVWHTDNYLDALIESNGAEMVIGIVYLTSSLCLVQHIISGLVRREHRFRRTIIMLISITFNILLRRSCVVHSCKSPPRVARPNGQVRGFGLKIEFCKARRFRDGLGSGAGGESR